MLNTDAPILNIKIESFDGPLDLLESLIREHKMDILNLDISILTEQYLNFIQKQIKHISIDEASEYLSMATYLLELKSKKVLPVENDTLHGSNFEYERDKLVNRIIEYKKYKDAIPKLLDKQVSRLEVYGKMPDDLENYASDNLILEKLPESINPSRLLKAMEAAYERWKLALFTKCKIIVQELAVEDIEKDIMQYLQTNKVDKITFSDFLREVDELKLSEQYVVTCFLALLELVKYRQINLSQESLQDDIFISKNNEADEMKESLAQTFRS